MNYTSHGLLLLFITNVVSYLVAMEHLLNIETREEIHPISMTRFGDIVLVCILQKMGINHNITHKTLGIIYVDPSLPSI